MKHSRGMRTGSGAVGQAMTRWIVVALLGCACGESTPPAESVTVQAPSEPEEAEAEEEGLEELPGDDLDEPIPLDEMDRPALEAACFAGQSAACDRLGH